MPALPVRGPNAASYNSFKGSCFIWVGLILVLGVLPVKVEPGGLDIDIWADPDHVFSVPLGFGVVTHAASGARGVLVFIKKDVTFRIWFQEPLVISINSDPVAEVL